MEQEFEEIEEARPIGASLVTSWVMGAMLIILTTFVSQFPVG